ncbi:MAG: hypothetical protein IK099_03035 [Clostridia bacterium]|nr:hypothetical protein [Clostridia bacterium]
MSYPQSFYSDLFDSYLTNAERVDASLLPRAERIKAIAAEIDRNDSAFADHLITHIPQPYQDILRKYYKEGISCTRMAKESGHTVSGVAYQKRRALRVIRDLIRENPSLTF